MRVAPKRAIPPLHAGYGTVSFASAPRIMVRRRRPPGCSMIVNNFVADVEVVF
jgi:hypothetical protein